MILPPFTLLCVVVTLLSQSAKLMASTIKVDCETDEIPPLASYCNYPTTGLCSIRSAWQTCFQELEPCEIVLPHNAFIYVNSSFGSFMLSSGMDVTIQGQGSTLQPIPQAMRFITSDADPSGNAPYLRIEMLTIENFGTAADDGAALSIAGNVTLVLEQVVFENLTAHSGGAIYMANNTLPTRISNSSFFNCMADAGGGAIAVHRTSAVLIANSFFKNCSAHETATGAGGSIQITEGRDILITDSVFSNSHANASGGAIYLAHNSVNATIKRSEFEHCSATVSGGGVYVYKNDKNILIMDSSFARCGAGHYSGAIGFEKNHGSAVLENVTVHDCHAASAGGGAGINSHTGSFLLAGSTFTSCSALKGGTLSVTATTKKFTLVHTAIKDSTSQFGGCAYLQNCEDVILMRGILFNCSAANEGGGIFGDTISSLTINDTSVSQCSARTNSGGGIFLQKTSLSLIGSTIQNCKSYNRGGALRITNSGESSSIENSVIRNSTAAGGGGGIYVDTIRSLVINDTVVSNCNALNSSGGGMYVQQTVLSLTGTTIVDCKGELGGALYLSNSGDACLIERCVLRDNTAANEGGGIFGDTISSLAINQTIINHCHARTGSGGGIFLQKTSLSLIGSTIKNCESSSRGGALRLTNSKDASLIENCVIRSNTAAYGGGGIDGDDILSLTMINTVISNCNGRADSGGGMFLGQTTLFMTFTTVENCKSEIGGGLSLYNSGQNSFIKNCVIQNNTATGDGGGGLLVTTAQDFLIHNSTFEHNSASNGNGGGFYVSAMDGFTIVNTSIQSNAAYYSGGGVYAGAQNRRFLFGGLHAMGNHALLSDGGGLYLSSELPNLAIVDGEAAANSVTVQTDHPYSHLRSYTIFDETYTTSLGFVITFDSRCKIGYDDFLYITAGKLEYTFGANSLYPGVDAAPLFVYATEVTLQFLGGQELVFPTEKLFGLKLYMTPLVSRSTQPCEFGSNRAGNNGGGMFANQGLISPLLLNSIFANNLAASSGGGGGGMYLHLSIQYFTMRSVSFTSNTAMNGGGIYLNNNLISNCFAQLYFSGNKAFGSGGGLFINLDVSGSLTDALFESNIAASGGGVAVQTARAAILFERIVFSENVAVKTLASGASFNGGAVALLLDNGKNAPISFLKCSFVNNRARDGGGAIFSDTSNVANFTDSVFANNSAPYGGAIFSQKSNQLTLGNCTFMSNTAKVSGGAIFALESTVLQIMECNFSSNKATAGGGIFLENRAAVNISNATFRQNMANEVGGAIVCIGSSLGTSSDSDLTFASNIANRGSAVFVKGASDDELILRNTKFVNNKALIGGTVYWVYDASMLHEPAVLNSLSISWYNNVAPYGNKSATQAVHLIGPLIYNITTYVQPTKSNPMVFTLLDFYGQYIPLDGTTSVLPTVDSTDKTPLCHPGHAALTGTDALGVVFAGGNATFNHLSPLCYPGLNMTINFTAELGSQFDRFETVSASVARSYYVKTITRVYFRACYVGEIIRGEVCVSCPNNTYSLISLVDSTTNCDSCNNMPGVITCRKNQLTLKKGYWRRFNTSKTVQMCPVALNGCKGGTKTGVALCEEGFAGPLCAVCANNYFQDGDECLNCNGPHRLPFSAIMFILAAGVVILLFTAYAYRRYHQLQNQELQNVRLKNLSSRIYNILDQVLLWWAARYRILIVKGKILIATYQIVTAVPTVLSVTVPKSFTSFLNGLDFVNFSFVSLLSLQCSVKYNFIDKLIVATLLPIGIVALLFVAFITHASYIAKEIKKNPHRKVGEGRALFNALKDQYLNYFFYLTYLILPSITTRIFKMFLCTNIDPDDEDNDGDENDLYLTADMNISCSSAYYHRGVAYAIFMIFVYPVGITSMYAYLLYTHRIEIQQRQCKSEEVEELLEPEPDAEAALEMNSDTFTDFAGELEAGRVSEIQHTVNPMLLSSQLSRSTTTSESTPTHPVYSKRPSRKNSIGRERTTSTATSIAGVSTAGPKNRYGMSAPAARLAFLWGAYHPVYWYWELIETSRRLMLTAVLSATGAGTSKQAVLALLLALIYIKLYGYFSPYEQGPSNVTAEVGQYQILVTFIGALILMESLLGRGYNPTVGALLVLFNLGVLCAFSYYEMRDLLEEQASVREAEASGDKGENESELRAGAKEAKLNGPRDIVEIEMTDVVLSK